MTATVSHQYTVCEEAKEFDQDKEAKITVGSTGVGKSSLIQLFCGNNVVVGHNTHSQTTKSTLFKQTNSNNKYWLDSQGANDSNGADDQKVLTDILKLLHDEQITKIKVIWFVSGDMCREKKEFQTQAAFIKSLGANVWKSCLIIKKRGVPRPGGLDGVLAAAKRHGANFKDDGFDRLFGFKGLEEPYKNDTSHTTDHLLELIESNQDMKIRKDNYKKYGYFTNHEIVHEITQKLSALPSLGIRFSIEKCEKCDVLGDRRYIYAPCHTKLEKWHCQPTQPYHPNNTRNIHTAGLKHYHPGRVQTKYQYERYHPGNWKDYKATNIVAGVLTAGIHTAVTKGGQKNHWTCCKNTGRGSMGCANRVINAINQYDCCSQSPQHAGCRQKYVCCDGGVGSDGCRKEWVCCSAVFENEGCKQRHVCCGNDAGSIGCKDRCQSCHDEWGISKGCTKTTK